MKKIIFLSVIFCLTASLSFAGEYLGNLSANPDASSASPFFFCVSNPLTLRLFDFWTQFLKAPPTLMVRD